MFGKIKDLYQLKSQADELKKSLNDVKIEKTQDDYKVVINGNLEIQEIIIPQNSSLENTSTTLKSLTNEAIKEAQQAMVKKMSDINGGMNPLA